MIILNPSPSISFVPSAMSDGEGMQNFERSALAHVDAAYNLARWLTNSDHDANTVVQEAYRHARRSFDGSRGRNVREWLLRIVHDSIHSCARDSRCAGQVVLDEVEDAGLSCTPSSDEPHAVTAGKRDKEAINAAISGLPVLLREVLVLRELEDLTYAEIAGIVDVSVGTVMSRLSRARGLMMKP